MWVVLMFVGVAGWQPHAPRVGLVPRKAADVPVTEYIVNEYEEEEDARVLPLPPSLALAIAPNALLVGALVGWQDEMVQKLVLGALACRALTLCATALARGIDDYAILSSGPRALVAALTPPPPKPPLLLGALSTAPRGTFLLSTIELTASKNRASIVAGLLKDYYESVSDQFPPGSLSIAQSKSHFVVTARFPADKLDLSKALRDHQSTDAFQSMTELARPYLAMPMALCLVNEVDGHLGNIRHPFGPGGEGGRDDAIYSSPANLDGSQVGSSLGVEAARTVDLDVDLST